MKRIGLMIVTIIIFVNNLSAQEIKTSGPTPQETLILEYMNRFRSNPKKEGLLIVEFLKLQSDPKSYYYRLYHGNNFQVKVDFKMFVDEMSKIPTVPPLVFNLKLIQSARNHSRYMIHSGVVEHSETKGKKGFTGANPYERVIAVNYKGGAVGENAFLNSTDPLGAHIGYLIDYGPPYGLGGMQPSRGHRMAMCSELFKEIGIGGVPHLSIKGKDLAVVENFGSHIKRMKKKLKTNNTIPSHGAVAVGRFVGGVVYQDRDKDNFYSIGEGIGNIKITSSDGAICETWKSGAYSMKLKSKGLVIITMEYSGIKKEFKINGGSENKKLDWLVTSQELIKDQRDLLKETDLKQNNLKLYLHIRQNGYVLNPDENKKAENATKANSTKLAEMFDQLNALIKSRDVKKLNIFLLNSRKKHKAKELSAIFKEIGWLKNGIANYLLLKSKRAKSSSGKFRKQLSKRAKKELSKLEKLKKTITFDEYMTYWDLLFTDLKSSVSKGSSK